MAGDWPTYEDLCTTICAPYLGWAGDGAATVFRRVLLRIVYNRGDDLHEERRMVELLDAMFSGFRRSWHCLRAWREVGLFLFLWRRGKAVAGHVSLVRHCGNYIARTTKRSLSFRVEFCNRTKQITGTYLQMYT